MATSAEPVFGRPGAMALWRVPALPAAAGLVLFAVMLLRPGILNDGDTYWHVAAGQWMLDHRQVLDRDVFSFTDNGGRWIALEWLSEAAMAGAYRTGGWSGVMLLFAAAAGATAFMLADRLSRRLAPLSATLALALAFALAAPSLLARPHVLALPCLAAWMLGLMDARAAGRSPPLWLAAVMVLWANLHGSYVFGFLLAAGFGLEALLEARERPWPVIRDWGLFGVLTLAAALATPHGLDGLIQPVRLLGLTDINAIDEWKPADFTHVGPLEVAMLATVFVALARGVRVPAVRLGLLLLVLHMTLQHHRHQPVLAIVAPLLLADPLAAALGAPADRRVLNPALGAALGALVLAAGAARLAAPVAAPEGVNVPIAALSHLPKALAGRPVLNSYGFGGYLIFTGQPVFIDGRADMYGSAFLRRYLTIRQGDPQALDRALAQYGVDWTLLEPTEPLARIMDSRPGWRRLYTDRDAVIHVRDAAGSKPRV